MNYVEPAKSTGEVEAIREKNFGWNANLAKRSRTFLNVVRYVWNFTFFSVNARILLNILRFHYSKARALPCVLPTFGPLGGGVASPPLKPPLPRLG